MALHFLHTLFPSSHSVSHSVESSHYLYNLCLPFIAAVITNETSLTVAPINICIFIYMYILADSSLFVSTSAYRSYAMYAPSPFALLHDVYTTLQRIAGCLLIFSRSDFSTCTYTRRHRHGHTDWRMHNLIYARAIKIYTRLLEYGKYALLNDAKRQLKTPMQRR